MYYILYRFCVYVQRQEEMIPKHEYFQIFGTSYMMNNKKEKLKLKYKERNNFLEIFNFTYFPLDSFSSEFHTSLSNNTKITREYMDTVQHTQQVKFATSIIRELSENYISIDLCVTITFVII